MSVRLNRQLCVSRAGGSAVCRTTRRCAATAESYRANAAAHRIPATPTDAATRGTRAWWTGCAACAGACSVGGPSLARRAANATSASPAATECLSEDFDAIPTLSRMAAPSRHISRLAAYTFCRIVCAWRVLDINSQILGSTCPAPASLHNSSVVQCAANTSSVCRQKDNDTFLY